MVENPADCGDKNGAAWWPRFKDHAPLWLFPRMRDALDTAGAEIVTIAQCAFDAPTRKYTTLACSADVRAHAAALESA
eukprot:4112882-Pleurochrysis_carterae.AAC.1